MRASSCVKGVSLKEDNHEKLHEKTLLEIGREEGMQEGLRKGIQQGIQQTVSVLKSLGHTDEVIIQKLMETYHMSGEEAFE